MSAEHLHSQIGKAISEAKRRLYKNLTNGTELTAAIAQFFRELQDALAEIVSKT